MIANALFGDTPTRCQRCHLCHRRRLVISKHFGHAKHRSREAIFRLALIGFGVVLIFVHIPGGAVIYAILGLVVFAGLTMVDFQRLRRSTDMDSAPLIAASIFLDALNVFSFFLQLFGGRGRD